jgi:hypothetical protein
MAIQNLFTSRDNNLDGNTYVGQLGRLWYNPDTNSLYASDGNTVGGIPVDLATNANILANTITVATITSTSSTVGITGNLVISGNISPAADGKIGGITPGPGVVISNQGVLTIDTAGLELSFGDFTASNNILTIINADEDMVLATSGNAEIQLVGNIGFYRPNGLPPDPGFRYFSASKDGQITILVPNSDPLLGAVQIIGSSTDISVSPAVAGVMLHITGQPNTFASQYIDGVNNFPNYIGRRYNGNSTSPTQILTGNTIVRFSGQGYPTDGFTSGASGSIGLDALEDFTTTNQGTIWRFLLNPVGGNTRQQVANIAVATGVSATQFNTAGNVTANNIVATGAVTSNSKTAGIGYRLGAGNVATQLNSKTDPVTLDALTGEITTHNSTIAGSTIATFILNNTAIANTDVMIINQVSSGNIGDYAFSPICNNGNAAITIRNISNQNRSDAIVMRFAVIRGAVA